MAAQVVEIVFINQEAKHQWKWEQLAIWCWEREYYLCCDMHSRRFIDVLDEQLLAKLTEGITV